jgi:hypothetical protein
MSNKTDDELRYSRRVKGNSRAADNGGNDHGVGEVSSTLHWGPAYNQNAYGKTHAEK